MTNLPADSPIRGYLKPEWRAAHPVEAISCDLLVDLGFDPPDVLVTTMGPGRVIPFDGAGRVTLEVAERDDRARPIFDAERQRFVTREVEVQISAERLARYLVDVAAAS